jgi:hypothetical protein
VAAEVVTQHRDEAGRQQHGGRQQRAPALHLVDDLAPRAGELEFRGPLGGFVGDGGVHDAVGAERALPLLGARHEVPDVVLVDQAPRIDQSAAPVPGPVEVVEADLAPAHHGPLQHLDDRGPLALPGAPCRRVDDHGVRGGLGVGAERAGQGPHELSQRGPHLGRGGGRRPGEQEQRLRLPSGESTEIGAGPAEQLPAAPTTRLGVHRHACGREGLEVATRRGHRDLELACHLRGGHPAAGLHQQQDRHQPVRPHTGSLPQKVLRG